MTNYEFWFERQKNTFSSIWGQQMKIDSVEIKGFGTLINRRFSFPQKGVTILTGKNEAGKTTFLEFTRRMLFGFPSGHKASKQYDPISGQVKGGLIALTLRDGRQFQIIRSKTSNKAFVQHVLFEDATARPVDELTNLIGKVSKEFYSRVFALSHRDLSIGGTLVQDNSIKHYLIGGLLAVKKYNPHALVESSTKRAGELFVPRGTKPTINSLNTEYQRIAGRIRGIENRTEEYLAKKEEHETLLTKKKTLSDEEAALRKRHSRNKSLAAVREHWVNLSQRADELNAITLPEGFSLHYDTRIEEIQTALVHHKGESDELISEHEDQTIKAGMIQLNENILNHETEIIQLDRLHQQYRTDLSQKTSYQGKIEQKERELKEALEGLGPYWTQEKIEGHSLTSEIKNNLFTAKVSLETYERELEQVTSGIRSAQEEIQRIKDDIPVLDPIKIDAQDTVRRAEELVSGIIDKEKEAARLHEEGLGLSEKRDEILRDLKERGIEITDSFLSSFNLQDLSDTTERFEDQIIEKKEAFREQTGRCEQTSSDLVRSIQEEEEISRQIASLGPVYSVAKLQKRLTQCKELSDLVSRRDNISQRPESHGDHVPGWMVIILGVMGIISTLAGVVSGQLLLSGFGLLILVLAIIFFMKIRSSEKIRKQDEEDLSERINTLSAEASIKNPDRQSIDKMILRVEQLIESSRRAEGFAFSKTQVQSRIKTIKTELEKAQSTLATTEQDLRDIHHRWSEWLSHTFSAGFSRTDPSPREVFTALHIIRDAAALISEEEENREKIKSLKDKAGRDYHDCLSLIKPVLSHFGITDVPAGADEMNQFISQINQQIDEEKQKESYISMQNRQIEERSRLLDRLSENQNTMRERMTLGRESFYEILSSAGLPKDVNPARLESLLQEVSAGRKILTDRNALLRDLEQVSSRIHDYESKVFELRDLVPDATMESSVDLLIERLVSLIQSEQERKRSYDSLLESLALIEEKLKNKEGAIRDLQNEEQNLLQELETTDYQEYSEYRERFRRREVISRDMYQKKCMINEILGDTDGLSQVADILQARSIDEIEADIESDTAELVSIRDKMSETDTQIGSVLTEIQNIESSEEHNRLLLEKNMLETSIKRYAEEWAVQTLAVGLLKQSLDTFEREKQPAVVSRAAGYFSQMTNGAYGKIFLPISGDEFEVVMDSGMIKHPGILSQGTAEQLFIALRLAYVSEYCANNEPLPLVLDDILVNCDENRRDRAIHAIGSVAKYAQVIYCTCHDDTTRRFSDLLDDVHVIDMESEATLSSQNPSPDELTIQGNGFGVF